MMGVSGAKVFFVALLGLALTSGGAHSAPNGIVGRLSTDHNLPMDGALPVPTHLHKGRQWVRANMTEVAVNEDAFISGTKKSTTAGLASIQGINTPVCLPQNQCCNIPGGLLKVPDSALDRLPFKNVALVALQLAQNDGQQLIATCSGTLTLQTDIVLTAGHCVTEITSATTYTQVQAAVVYFGVSGGTCNNGPCYSRAVNVVNFATFADWANENIEIADHALLQLETAQPGPVTGTQDISQHFSHETGVAEPFTSVGFPGGGGYGNPNQMYYTPNPHRNQCMGLYAPGSAVSETFAINLAIHEGMSGGPVVNTLQNIIATNSFSLTSTCSSGLCYNGYTPINNLAYPLSQLLSLLTATPTPSG